MGYVWPGVEFKGASRSAWSRHMAKYHPCCKQDSNGSNFKLIPEVEHPVLNRPLILEALPTLMQARIAQKFGQNVPVTHTFPQSIETLFEEQPRLEEVLEVFIFNLRISILMNLCQKKIMMIYSPIITMTNSQRYHFKYVNLILESQSQYG
jgi:hypothetical protein